jgi:ketosteroid isomerase-like protein
MTTEPGFIHAERLEGSGRSAEEARNVALVGQIFEAWSRSEFDVFYSHTARGAVVDVIGLTREKMGKHLDNPDLVPQTFNRGMRFEVLRAVVEGSRVCVQWNDEAETSKGFLYRNRGLSVFEFNGEGKITHYFEYLDPDNFLEAIGAK